MGFRAGVAADRMIPGPMSVPSIFPSPVDHASINLGVGSAALVNLTRVAEESAVFTSGIRGEKSVQKGARRGIDTA